MKGTRDSEGEISDGGGGKKHAEGRGELYHGIGKWKVRESKVVKLGNTTQLIRGKKKKDGGEKGIPGVTGSG